MKDTCPLCSEEVDNFVEAHVHVVQEHLDESKIDPYP